MLYDEISVQQILDRECAHEFLKEATRLASSSELGDIGADLEIKSRSFAQALGEEALATLDPDGLSTILDQVFLVRRKRRLLLRDNDFSSLRAEIGQLVHGDASVADRFDRFVARVEGLSQPLVVSLASELLHFSAPDRYWLWTPWIWDAKTGAGVLPLLLKGDDSLRAGTLGETYTRVGWALDVVDTEGHSDGFTNLGRGRFGTDVYLACVYAVYMYTVFRMRLSKEFNRLLPELPELTRRILGVHRGRRREAHV